MMCVIFVVALEGERRHFEADASYDRGFNPFPAP